MARGGTTFHVTTFQGRPTRPALIGLFLAGLYMAGLLLPGPAEAAGARPYRAPRTAYGAPDLQGYWTNVAQTPLERPRGVPLTFPTEAEAKAYEKKIMDRAADPTDDVYGQSASEWRPVFPLARIDGRARTSWIVSPADGRIPYRPEARDRLAKLDAAQDFAADGPEQRTLSDRCLVGGGATGGPPMLNHHSGSAVQILQTRDTVAIRIEMNHDVRIIRLGAHHAPPAVRAWLGDSIGHWEGDTLVVETTGFMPQDGYRMRYLMSPDARVTERLTRVSPTELRYTFEVDDPATVTQPWRGEMPFHPEKSPIWEYACHEGNYSMSSILAGARREESLAATGC